MKQPYFVVCMAGQTKGHGQRKGRTDICCFCSSRLFSFLFNDLSRHTPPILSATFFGWIPQLLRIPEGEMLDIVGLDAVMVCFFKIYGTTGKDETSSTGRTELQHTHATSNVSYPLLSQQLNCFAYCIPCFVVSPSPTQCEYSLAKCVHTDLQTDRWQCGN